MNGKGSSRIHGVWSFPENRPKKHVRRVTWPAIQVYRGDFGRIKIVPIRHKP